MGMSISLHIGLNQVNAKVYGSLNPLKGCVNDANAMLNICHRLGYSQSTLLINGQATKANVVSVIKSASKQLNAGDLFFLSYSGHGSTVKDRDKDETDHQDEAWCLYDGLLLDDTLYELWQGFRENVRILVISDSCHSGTVISSLSMTEDHLPRYLATTISQKVYEAAETKPGPSTQSRIPPLCTIKLFAACQDLQLAYDGATNGLFTSKLLQVWNNGSFAGNYLSFFYAVSSQMPPYQTPNYISIGKVNAVFDNQIPFTP